MRSHDKAMLLAKEAEDQPSSELRKDLFGRALELEVAEAGAETTEPSRSILYRSAAWLALEAGLPDEAIRLGKLGLSGVGVSERIANELREVIREANKSNPSS